METNQAKQKHTKMKITASTSRRDQADVAMVLRRREEGAPGKVAIARPEEPSCKTRPASGLSIMQPWATSQPKGAGGSGFWMLCGFTPHGYRARLGFGNSTSMNIEALAAVFHRRWFSGCVSLPQSPMSKRES